MVYHRSSYTSKLTVNIAMSHSLAVYTHLGELPNYLGVFLLIIFGVPYCFIIVLYMICVKSCSDEGNRCVNVGKWLAYAPWKVIALLGKAIFSSPTGLLQDRLQDDDVYINNKKVPEHTLRMLGVYVLAFIWITFLVCWKAGLIEETVGNCDSTRDCFVTTDEVANIPVTNCSDYKNANDVTIVCYHFFGAIGAVPAIIGGMLSLIQIGIKFIMNGFLFFKSISYKLLSRLHYSAWIILPFLYVPVVVIVCLFAEFSRNNIHQFVGNAILIFLGLYITLFIPWHYFTFKIPEACENRYL